MSANGLGRDDRIFVTLIMPDDKDLVSLRLRPSTPTIVLKYIIHEKFGYHPALLRIFHGLMEWEDYSSPMENGVEENVALKVKFVPNWRISAADLAKHVEVAPLVLEANETGLVQSFRKLTITDDASDEDLKDTNGNSDVKKKNGDLISIEYSEF